MYLYIISNKYKNHIYIYIYKRQTLPNFTDWVTHFLFFPKYWNNITLKHVYQVLPFKIWIFTTIFSLLKYHNIKFTYENLPILETTNWTYGCKSIYILILFCLIGIYSVNFFFSMKHLEIILTESQPNLCVHKGTIHTEILYNYFEATVIYHGYKKKSKSTFPDFQFPC